jgi:hypothetical protein
VEVRSAGRSQDKLIRAEHHLGQVHTVVMEITDEGTVEKALRASAVPIIDSSRPGPFAAGRS